MKVLRMRLTICFELRMNNVRSERVHANVSFWTAVAAEVVLHD